MIDILDARYLSGYVVWLRFGDGREGAVDLSRELTGSMFRALRDPELFRQVELDRDLSALVWPNGADFTPDFLYPRIRPARSASLAQRS